MRPSVRSLRALLVAAMWCATGFAAAASADEPYHLREVWLDAARQRHVNVRISFAAPRHQDPAQRPQAVFLFSSPDGYRWGGYHDHYEYLAEELARRGIVMVTLSHFDVHEPLEPHETFAQVYPGILTGRRDDPPVDRYDDMRFVLRELARIDAERRGDWPVLDTSRVGVGGHSSGVLTALHLCGMPVRDRHGQVHADQRLPEVKAFVIMGYPLEYSGPERRDLKRVHGVPGLHLVGSDDAPAYRQTSYRYITGAPQFWMVVTGNHDVGALGPFPLLQEAIGGFLGSYLLDDGRTRTDFGQKPWQASTKDLHAFERQPEQWWRRVDRSDVVAWLRDTLPWGTWLHDWSLRYHRSRKAHAE